MKESCFECVHSRTGWSMIECELYDVMCVPCKDFVSIFEKNSELEPDDGEAVNDR